MRNKVALALLTCLLVLSNFVTSISPAKAITVQGVTLEPGANLSGKDLRNLNLSGVNLSGANLSGALLGSSNLQNAKLDGADLTQANLYGADLRGASLKLSKITDADFSTSKLQSADLSGAMAIGSEDQITDVNFNGAVLTGASLEGASLQGVDFTGANLRDVSLRDSSLRWIRFDFSSIAGTDFLGAEFVGQISGKVLGVPQNLPAKWTMRAGFLLGPGAVYSARDLRNLDLSNLDLTGSNFIYANLTGANLSNSTLKNSHLTGANLTGANFEGIKSGGVEWFTNGCCPGTLPDKFSFRNGFLIGPGADLSNENLSGLSFEGLVYGNGVNFSGSNLSGADFHTSFMRGTNFAGSDLKGTNFEDSNLSEVNLALADITGANFNRTNLENVNLLGTVDLHRDSSLSPDFELVDGTYFGSFQNLYIQVALDRAQVGALSRAVIWGVPPDVSVKVHWELDGHPLLKFGEYFRATAETLGKFLSARFVMSKSGYLDREIRTESLPVLAGTFARTPTPKIAGTFRVGQTLTASPGNWEAGVTLSYQWLREGKPIKNATKPSYSLVAGDNGKQVSIEVTARKPGYTSAKTTSTSTKTDFGVLTLTPTPKVTGTFRVGQTLTASPGNWEAGVTLSYQWLRDGEPIKNATAPTFVLSATDLGKTIGLQMTGEKLGYSKSVAKSLGSKTSAGLMPGVRPQITGSTKIGGTLRAASSPWVIGTSISYVWMSNGEPIEGETTSRLIISSKLKGTKITVVVTQSAPGYASKSMASDPVKVNS